MPYNFTYTACLGIILPVNFILVSKGGTNMKGLKTDLIGYNVMNQHELSEIVNEAGYWLKENAPKPR
jgi:hypothetical protein